MEERISRVNLNLKIAELVSLRGTCGRARVGAVITNLDGRIISTGYNGPIKGDNHCSEVICDLTKQCSRAIHAEANAIYSAAKMGISLKGCILYATHHPCHKCLEAIISSGIEEIYYLFPYHGNSPLSKLVKITQVLLP